MRTATRKKNSPARQQLGYQPAPYHQDADETVDCPDCGRGNDTDASYCDQCGMQLTPSTEYSAGADEDVTCPNCECVNDDDAEYCDQCGIRLTGRDDVTVGGESEPGVGDEYDSRHPRSNLLRARPLGSLLRSDEPDSPSGVTLCGYFSEFNTWYEIDSFWEGTFMERVAPGAFADTIANDRDGMRVLFDHGMDWNLSFKPLGPITVLEERDEGPYYEVPLYDTDYNRDFLIPVLRGQLMTGETVGSGLGASMRFQVQEDQWNSKPKASKTNPQALPERTILRAKVLEFGPVTFPANAGATAGLRSRSDVFMARLAGDGRFLAAFTERVGVKVAQRILAEVPEDLRAAMQRGEPPAPPVDPVVAARRELLRRRARAIIVTAG